MSGNQAAGINNAAFIAAQNGIPIDPEQRGKFIGLNFGPNMAVAAGANGFLNVDSATAPGGSSGGIQYNDAGTFNGTPVASFAYDKANDVMQFAGPTRYGPAAGIYGGAGAGYQRFQRAVAEVMSSFRDTATDRVILAKDNGSVLYIGQDSLLTAGTMVAEQWQGALTTLRWLISGVEQGFISGTVLGLKDGHIFRLGATGTAATGDMRVRNGFEECGRNAANSADILLVQLDASNYLWIGDNATNTKSTDRTHLRANNVVLLGVQGSNYAHFDSQELMIRTPVLGYDLFSSPYGVHGATTHTFAADANYTVLANQYKYDRLEFITGVITAGRTVTFPHPATLVSSYEKTIWNNTNQTLTISTGTGATVTLATTLKQRFEFSSAGVTIAGPTY